MRNVEDMPVQWRYGQARDLMESHNELLGHIATLMAAHNELKKAHNELVGHVTEVYGHLTTLANRVNELQRRLEGAPCEDG